MASQGSPITASERHLVHSEYEREPIRDRITKHLDSKRDKDEVIGTVPRGFEVIATGRGPGGQRRNL